MKLSHKLIIGFSLISLLIPAVGYYTVNISQKALEDSIGHDAEILARETMDKIDRSIYHRIEEIRTYSKALILQEYVLQSNKEFERLSDMRSYIDKEDREWVSSEKSHSTPFMDSLLGNRLSREIREKINFIEGNYGYRVYGEIFVTNKYGAVVALTGKTSDYRQDDEQWWQIAKRDGVFTQDVEYDESADIYSVDLGIRIEDKRGDFLGVIKAVLNIEEPISIVSNLRKSEERNSHKSGHFKLITGDGRLIYSTNDFSIFEDVSYLMAHIGHGIGEHAISFVLEGDKAGDATKFISHADSMGVLDFEGLGWILLIEHDAEDLFAPVYSLRKRLLTTSLCVAAIGILLGLLFSVQVTGGLRKLKSAAIKIGKGDLDTKIDIKSHDEIGDLAASFKKMVEDLQETTVSKTALERSNAELQQFAYVASHDLQEPLRMVSSYLQLLERRYKDRLDDDAREFIEYAVDGAYRMKTLIQDLLTYSRVTTRGKEFTKVDALKVFDQVVSNLQIAIEESDARVSHDALPTVKGDGTQLTQLFQNLISNAIKFHGDKAPRVHVSAQDRGDKWVFSVSDNGIGIDPEYRERIFRIFQRLHNKADYPGTGIGLAVCRKIVSRHGGDIWTDGGPDNGSTFYFSIPNTEEVVNHE